MMVEQVDVKSLDAKRRDLGWSMSELSLRSGVQQRTVERMFAGDVVPRRYNLDRIVAALEGKPLPSPTVKPSVAVPPAPAADVPPIAQIVTLFLRLSEEEQKQTLAALSNLLPRE